MPPKVMFTQDYMDSTYLYLKQDFEIYGYTTSGELTGRTHVVPKNTKFWLSNEDYGIDQVHLVSFDCRIWLEVSERDLHTYFAWAALSGYRRPHGI